MSDENEKLELAGNTDTVRLDTSRSEPSYDTEEAEEYGTSIGGALGKASRWFDGEPDVSRERVVPVRERWWCPMSDCDGEMTFNGSTWPTGRPGYHHTCGECGFTAAVRGKKYPRITHVPPDD